MKLGLTKAISSGIETVNYKITLKRGHLSNVLVHAMQYKARLPGKLSLFFYSLMQSHSHHHPSPLLLSMHEHRIICVQGYKHKAKIDRGYNHLTKCVPMSSYLFQTLFANSFCQIYFIRKFLIPPLSSFIPISTDSNFVKGSILIITPFSDKNLEGYFVKVGSSYIP